MIRKYYHSIISFLLISALLLSGCSKINSSDSAKSAEEYEAQIEELQSEIAALKAQMEQHPSVEPVPEVIPEETVNSNETSAQVTESETEMIAQPDTQTHVSEFIESADTPELGEDRTQIVVFGDSIWDSTRDETGVAHLLSQYMNADVYNCAIGGTRATLGDGEDTDNFDTWTSNSLSGMVNAAVGRVNSSQFLTGYVAGGVMQNIDFSKTDYFIIAYGLNDYFSAAPKNPTGDYALDAHSYRGALRFAIDSLRHAYPEAEILLISPTYCQFWSEGTDGNTKNFGEGTCMDYFFVCQNVAQVENTLFIDAYTTLGINGHTAYNYLSDGIHLNAAGRELYAKAVSSCLKYGTPGEVSGNSIHY